jgi:uncharacterized membrane protein YjgN (DUF898 family)
MSISDAAAVQAPLLPATAGDAPAARPPSQPTRLGWLEPMGLFMLSLSNFGLQLATLGVYIFWAKTEARRRVWSAVRIDGEPLSYSGTGKEMALGLALVLAVVSIPVSLLGLAVYLVLGTTPEVIIGYQAALAVGLLFVSGLAVYRMQRYRLSRTSWRGIRFALAGSSLTYAWAYFWTWFLIPLTLGWIVPWRSTYLQHIMLRDMRFGDRPFSFTATAGPLYKPFAVFWAVGLVFILPGIILYPLWLAPYAFYIRYRARQFNHYAAHTRLGDVSLEASLRGGDLIGLALLNWALRSAGFLLGLVVLALLFGGASALIGTETLKSQFDNWSATSITGLLTQGAIFGSVLVLAASGTIFHPFILARNARYIVEKLDIRGTLPADAIAQGAEQRIATGEGLAQAFDVDAF